MSLLNTAKVRFSARNYTETAITKEQLDQILQIAHVAPSAANLQPIRLLVVQTETGLKRLAKACNIYDAPLAIIVCADTKKAWKRPYDAFSTADIDASIVTDHMMLQATELGLGTVWICYFDPKRIKTEFSLPDGIEPINILAIGKVKGSKADPDRHTKTRIPLKDLVHFESFS